MNILHSNFSHYYEQDETTLPFPCSDVAAVFGTNAIRILYAGAFCDDGGMRMDGIPILSATKNSSNVGIQHISNALPADVQDCVG